MRTNNQPATSLPWSVQYIAARPQIVAGNAIIASMLLVRESDDDAAYIAHAVNAYPKLVKALRFFSDQPRYGVELDSARAILRELGETE